MKLRVAILGSGSWGTTVASLVGRNAKVTLWSRNKETAQEINENRSNSKYLPETKLHKSLTATPDLKDAVTDIDVLIVAVPSQGFREVLKAAAPHVRPWIPVISLTKGLEAGSLARMTEIIEDELPGHPAGVLTGPNLAREIMAGQPAAAVIATTDYNIVGQLQKLFQTALFKVYTNDDVVGCELGGVLKNIIAIAVGMCDGFSAGENIRAAIITRGLAEVSRLGVALGGQAATFYGLAGMGDMIATCTSPLSRNYTVGVELAKGKSIEQITNEMFMVAEGVKTAPTVIALAKKAGVEMPITQDVYRVIQGKATAMKVFRSILREQAGAESEPERK